MKKKAVDEKQKIVQLKQLVTQPQCLKLLILHTPFTLNLDSLYQCINLVKLDLSKNNLTAFPYLGELPNLKFMFIHDNKLDIDSLVGIFQESIGKQSRSPLSKAIIWVTYWGNKNQFNARHYLVNHTSVLAVDNHLVVQEEKNQAIFVGKKFTQPFNPTTNISDIFQNRKKFNKSATEEEYMVEFWEEMARIRKRHMEINSIIKIQKVFRGWSYRLKQSRRQQQIIQGKQMVAKMFISWKRQSTFQKKLRLIFKKRDKSYLLLPIKQMKLQAAKRKIIEFVQSTKKKIILRKMNLKSQYKFFNVIKSNQQALKSLYTVLHIELSSYLMVHIDGIQQFTKYVIPVAKSMNGGVELKLEDNQNIALRYLYEPPRRRRQFLRLLQLNQKSIVSQLKQKPDEIQLKKKTTNYTIYKCETPLSKIYNKKNVHFSVSEIEKMESIKKSFKAKNILDLSELKRIEGNKQVLKDIVRGCYFYNMGYLTNGVIPTDKINFLSQYSIKKISSIIKIQRMWRGINLRRKIRDVARNNFILNRAAVKIQRWFRNLSWYHRKQFMFQIQQQLKGFQNEYFYVRLENYMEILTATNETNCGNTKMSFPQQNILPFICIENKKLLISWNRDAQNEGAFINSIIGKQLFTQRLLKNIFNDWDFQGPILNGMQQKYEKCEISHLFHYQTQVSIVNKKNSQYLEIKCASKYDCRLRILAIKLLTYNFHQKKSLELLPKQSISFYSSELSFKRPIGNQNSIFISQSRSSFQIEALSKESSKTFELNTKFYINSEQNKKPIKFATTLKIIMVFSKEVQSHKKQARSVSYNENFDLQSFLIAETNEIRVPNQNLNLAYQLFSSNAKNNKQSLKNMKLDRKIRLKKREKIYSQHSEKKQKFNFMLGDPQFQERLTTQPDLTHQRSMGSIANDPSSTAQKGSLHKSDIKVVQSRISEKKKIVHNESQKAQNKNVAQFTKNFINQGNFIQNQFLYGQIKKLKTQIQRNSVDQVTRVKTQQDQRYKYIQRLKDDRIKRAQQAHLKHKEQQFKSVIEKHTAFQLKQKQKNEVKQSNYKSLPRRMRINFAEECYPIIGKHPNSNSLPKGQ